MNEKYEQLVADYLAGSLDEEGKLRVEQLIANGEIELIEFKAIEQLHDELDVIATPAPSSDLSTGFYAMLEKEKAASRPFSFSAVEKLKAVFAELTMPRLVYACLLLIIGGFIGDQFGRNESKLEELSAEMQDMRQMMMVSMLEGASTTDRIRAVNISAELPVADEKAIQALLFTLNNDKSVNVRVQTVEALSRWGDNEMVREGMVNAITNQDSEVVIIALADAVVSLGLKNSAKELEELLKYKELDINVQQKLQTSIAALL